MFCSPSPLCCIDYYPNKTITYQQWVKIIHQNIYCLAKVAWSISIAAIRFITDSLQSGRASTKDWSHLWIECCSCNLYWKHSITKVFDLYDSIYKPSSGKKFMTMRPWKNQTIVSRLWQETSGKNQASMGLAPECPQKGDQQVEYHHQCNLSLPAYGELHNNVSYSHGSSSLDGLVIDNNDSDSCLSDWTLEPLCFPWPLPSSNCPSPIPFQAMPLHKYANEAGFSVQTDGFYDAIQHRKTKTLLIFVVITMWHHCMSIHLILLIIRADHMYLSQWWHTCCICMEE